MSVDERITPMHSYGYCISMMFVHPAKLDPQSCNGMDNQSITIVTIISANSGPIYIRLS